MKRFFPLSVFAAMLIAAPVFCLADDLPRVSAVVAEKQAISKPDPKYPPMARQMKITGSVAVNVTIDEEGNVEKAEIAEGNPILASAAVMAAKAWKFHPFLKDGKAEKVTTQLAFRFTI